MQEESITIDNKNKKPLKFCRLGDSCTIKNEQVAKLVSYPSETRTARDHTPPCSLFFYSKGRKHFIKTKYKTVKRGTPTGRNGPLFNSQLFYQVESSPEFFASVPLSPPYTSLYTFTAFSRVLPLKFSFNHPGFFFKSSIV